MSEIPPENVGTVRRLALRAAAAALAVLAACACPEPTPAPPPATVPHHAEAAPDVDKSITRDSPRRPAPGPARSPRAGPLSPPPTLPLRTLDAAGAAALHRSCPVSGCPAGLTCVEYCGVAGCRPGLVFHSCELPCGRSGTCPDGYTCATIADGPGRVCSGAGDGDGNGTSPRPRPPTGHDDR